MYSICVVSASRGGGGRDPTFCNFAWHPHNGGSSLQTISSEVTVRYRIGKITPFLLSPFPSLALFLPPSLVLLALGSYMKIGSVCLRLTAYINAYFQQKLK